VSVRSIVAAVLVAAAAGAVAPAAAQDHDEAPDTVRLAFAWPPGAHADVAAQRSRDRSENGRQTRGRATLRYRIALEPSGEGYLVRYSGFAGDSPGAGTPPAEIAAHVAAFTPSYLVSRDGEFRDLGDPGAMRALVDSLVGPLTAELTAANPAASEFLASITSDAMLRSAAEQDWNMLVGTWAGAEFVIGDVYASNVVEHFPLFGGVDLPMDYEFSAAQRVPCDSADSGLGCVALQMESRPDPAAVSRVLGAALAGVIPADSASLASAAFDVRNTVHLIARPESLLPYRLTVTKDVRLTLPENGRTSEYRQVDVRDQVFVWKAVGR
jgi:hypothetical protein